MNLTLRAARSLPLAAALMSGDEVVASTPEWSGPSLGCVTYVVRGSRLVVDTGAAVISSPALLGMLLNALDEVATHLTEERADRARVLAASLRVLAARTSSARGTVEHALRMLHAAASARTEVTLETGTVRHFGVGDPAVVALIAVQVIANAERHDAARVVRIDAADHVIRLSWHGDGGAARTARRRAERSRWGLGFARVAADSIGAVVGVPLASPTGEVGVSIDVGVRRLALPLACVRDGRVRSATATWDEETGLAPGSEAARSDRLANLCNEAANRSGDIVHLGGWTARHGGDDTWVAIPPDGVGDRVGDILDGLVHERALWDGVPLADRARVVALSAVVGATVGIPLPRVTAMSWNAAANAVAAAVGYTRDVPEITGVGAVDPQVALSLAVALDGTLTADDDELILNLGPGRDDDFLLSGLRPVRDGTRLAL